MRTESASAALVILLIAAFSAIAPADAQIMHLKCDYGNKPATDWTIDLSRKLVNGAFPAEITDDYIRGYMGTNYFIISRYSGGLSYHHGDTIDSGTCHVVR